MPTTVSLHPTTPYFRAGGPAQFAMTIDTDHRIEVHEAYIRLIIWEGATNRIRDRWTVLDERCVVADRGVIPIGSTTFSATFQIPATCPPTHDTRPGFVVATATAVVAKRRPWRRWDTEQAVVVRRVSNGPVVGVRSQQRSQSGLLAVDLRSNRLTVGEPVVGWLRWSPRSDRNVMVTMQLASASRLPGDASKAQLWHERRFSVPPGEHDRTVPWAFDMPADLPPSYESASHTRDWRLVVRGPGESVTVPLEIIDAMMPSTTRGVGAEELGAGLSPLLPHGWEAVPDAVVVPSHGILWPAVRRDEGASEIVIGALHTDSEPLRLYARVTTPSLGLGLRVVPSSPLRELFVSDVEVGVRDWDRRYRVSARDEAGAAAHLAAWIGELTSLPPLVAWDDTHLAFSRAFGWGESEDLRPLASELVRVARAHGPKAPGAGPYR